MKAYDVKDDFEFRWQVWNRHQSVMEPEMNRRNFLKQPVPSTINPEHLYAPTRVRVLRKALGSYTSTNVCGSRRHTKALGSDQNSSLRYVRANESQR